MRSEDPELFGWIRMSELNPDSILQKLTYDRYSISTVASYKGAVYTVYSKYRYIKIRQLQYLNQYVIF
jgi:hypothetical protein